jgi:hypothetical protein
LAPVTPPAHRGRQIADADSELIDARCLHGAPDLAMA